MTPTPEKTCAKGPFDLGPLKDLSIIYFGNDWFAENRTSSHHIARQLANHLPLLYIDSPGMRAPTASARDLRKILRTAGRFLAPPKQVGQRIWHLTMPQIPYRRLPFVDHLNRVVGRWLVLRAIRYLRFHRRLTWFAVPHPCAMAGRIGDEFVVYYCVDDYASLSQMDSERIQRLDDELTARANFVFVCSQTLLGRKRQLNVNVEYSPHGVDFDLFSRAQDPATEVAESAKNLARPIIGYFGSVSQRIDFDLLAYLAIQRPRWTFLLIGMISVDASILKSMPNVRLVGAKPYETLPRWAKAFDVAIVPYRADRFNLHSNPLKVREYLATGKPVVSVFTPEIGRYGAVVAVAESREAFLEEIEQALLNDSLEARQARMDAVKESSWQACAGRALSHVRQAFEH